MASSKPSVSQLSLGTGNVYISWSFPPGTDCVELETSWGDNRWVYSSGTYSTIDSPTFNENIYWARVIAWKSDGSYTAGWSDYTVFSLSPAPPPSPPDPPSNIQISQSGRTLDHTVTFTKGDRATSTVIDVNVLGGYEITGTSYSFTVPNYNQFAVRAYSKDDYGQTSGWSDWVYKTPTPPYPVPGLPTGISVSYSGMNATITWTTGSNATYTDVWNTYDNTHGTTAGTTWNFTVPNKGINYVFKLASANPDNVSGWTDPIVIFIAARPSNFVGSLYKTATDGNDVIDTAQWHAFATRINEFRAYKGLSQYTYAYLTNAQNGNDFMADYFNEMLNSMNFCTDLPSSKSSGNSIYKSYFDTMVNRLNAVV